MARAFVLAGVLAVSAVSLSAEQTPLHSRGNPQFGALRTQRSNDPYRALFTPQRPLPAEPAAPSEPKTSSHWGTTILEADPYFDQKKTAPKDGTKYTIRAIPPPECAAPR